MLRAISISPYQRTTSCSTLPVVSEFHTRSAHLWLPESFNYLVVQACQHLITNVQRLTPVNVNTARLQPPRGSFHITVAILTKLFSKDQPDKTIPSASHQKLGSISISSEEPEPHPTRRKAQMICMKTASRSPHKPPLHRRNSGNCRCIPTKSMPFLHDSSPSPSPGSGVPIAPEHANQTNVRRDEIRMSCPPRFIWLIQLKSGRYLIARRSCLPSTSHSLSPAQPLSL